MILRTYRITSKDHDRQNFVSFLRDLRYGPLAKDNYWHAIWDYEGATLRFLPKSEEKTNKWLKANCKSYELSFEKRLNYEPLRNEHWGVSFVGDDILPILHEITLLTSRYSPNTLVILFMERILHVLMLNAGVVNHAAESEVYLAMAFSRARVGQHFLHFPKWFYKICLKLRRII